MDGVCWAIDLFQPCRCCSGLTVIYKSKFVTNLLSYRKERSLLSALVHYFVQIMAPK